VDEFMKITDSECAKYICNHCEITTDVSTIYGDYGYVIGSDETIFRRGYCHDFSTPREIVGTLMKEFPKYNGIRIKNIEYILQSPNKNVANEIMFIESIFNMRFDLAQQIIKISPVNMFNFLIENILFITNYKRKYNKRHLTSAIKFLLNYKKLMKKEHAFQLSLLLVKLSD
jgi:hypothetical protein